MNKTFKSYEPIVQVSTEEQKRQADLRQARVKESLVKLSHKEEAVIEEETFRFLIIQHRQEKLNRRRGVPSPPAPGNIAYAVYS